MTKAARHTPNADPGSPGGAPPDPLVWAVVVLYRRWWLPALGGIVGLLAGLSIMSPAPPSYIADAQLYIQERPAVAGGLQEPINAVAYKALLESDRMREAAKGALALHAGVETTQDTNFGKYYSPVIELQLTANSAGEAKAGMAAWREAFLADYGDLASRPARERLGRLEARLASLEEESAAAYDAELEAEERLRPLLLRRADAERGLAPFTLELPEPALPRPRAQVYTREQVVAQDVSVASEGDPGPHLEPIAGALPAPVQPADLAAFGAEWREALADFHRLRAARMRLEAEQVEVARHAETNRLIVAGATSGGGTGDGAASTATAFEAADVAWLPGPAEPRLARAGRPRFLLALFALAGAALAAGWILVAAVAGDARF